MEKIYEMTVNCHEVNTGVELHSDDSAWDFVVSFLSDASSAWDSHEISGFEGAEGTYYYDIASLKEDKYALVLYNTTDTNKPLYATPLKLDLAFYESNKKALKDELSAFKDSIESNSEIIRRFEDPSYIPERLVFLAKSESLTKLIAKYMNGVCGRVDDNITGEDVSDAILNNISVTQKGIIDHSTRPDGGYEHEIDHASAVFGEHIGFESYAIDNRDFTGISVEHPYYCESNFDSVQDIVVYEIRFNRCTPELLSDALIYADLACKEGYGWRFDSFYKAILNNPERLVGVITDEQKSSVRKIVEAIVIREEELFKQYKESKDNVERQ